MLFPLQIFESCFMAIDNEEFAAFIKFSTRDIPPHPDIGRRILRRISEIERSDIVKADKSTLASGKKVVPCRNVKWVRPER